MRQILPASILAAVLLAVACPAQGSFAGGWYQDPTLGFQVRPPADWTQVPTQPDEEWVVGLFQSKKEYSNREGYSRKLLMRVIMFDTTPEKKPAEKKDKDKQGKDIEDLPEVIRFGRKLIHKSYKDYVKRTLSGGGFYFNVDKDRGRGVPGKTYEVKIEKLTWEKRRLVAWDFTRDDVSFAVEFDVYEEHYKKLLPELTKVFRSFKFIDRVADAATGDSSAPTKIPRDKEWKKLPMADRHGIRKKLETEQEEKLLAKLPKDWKVSKTDHFLVISHGDAKFTNAIVKMGEACFAWLEDRFGSLSDEYVRRSIIRICKDYDEYRAYHTSGSGGWGFSISFGSSRREVSELQFYDGERMAWQWSYFMGNLFRHYLADKDDELMDDAPAWLSWGISEMLDGTVIKGNKVTFEPTLDQRIAAAKLKKKGGFRNGSLKTVQELMSLTSKEIYDLEKKDKEAGIRAQLGYLVRFLEGTGRRHKLFKGQDFLVEYCRAATASTEQYRKDHPNESKETHKEATTEEEEERQAERSRARSEEFSNLRQKQDRAVLDALNKKACNFDEKEWKLLTQAYARTVK